MPSYRTRTARTKKKKKLPRASRRLPQDPRKLFRWAARGSERDYEKLRQLARKARKSLPTHIDDAAFEKLEHVDRLTMIEEIQAAEEHNISAGWFLDAVNWLFDKVPFGNWIWPVSAAQSSINAQKGDGLNEVDEQYARLVGATYGAVQERPFVIDHWKRQVQFDSDYISVFDNPDGHRVICVRGTQGTALDIGEDIMVGITGRTTNAIGDELLQILAASPEGMVIDLAAHSLGGTLALQAYDNKLIYNAVHETYLYSPAYSPFLRGTADAYERDENVRYFINVRDAVTMGSLGHQAPANAVFRSSGDPLSAHKIAQWQGSSAYQDPIYHAPPETRVHAHKQVYAQSVSPKGDGLVNVPESAGAVEPPAGEPAATDPFDFGDVPAYDYANL